MSEPAFLNTSNVAQQLWRTAVQHEMTCWDGGLITMQRTQEMNSARRHARRWHHLLECLFHCLLCRLDTRMPLAEHTGPCLKCFHLLKVPGDKSLLNTQILKNKKKSRKSIQSKRLTSILMVLNCCLNGKKTKTTGPDTGCLPWTFKGAPDSAAGQVYVHSQSRCYSGLSVSSGPSTRGRQVARLGNVWLSVVWVDVK